MGHPEQVRACTAAIGQQGAREGRNVVATLRIA
jgi:hypothetical protein